MLDLLHCTNLKMLTRSITFPGHPLVIWPIPCALRPITMQLLPINMSICLIREQLLRKIQARTKTTCLRSFFFFVGRLKKKGKLCQIFVSQPMDDFVKYALIVLAVILVVILLSKLSSIQARRPECISVSQLQMVAADVKKLWNLAKQDRNTLLSVLHTTAALSKLATLHQLDTSGKLDKKLDIDFEQLRTAIHALQEENLRDINTRCPELALDHELDWST